MSQLIRVQPEFGCTDQSRSRLHLACKPARSLRKDPSSRRMQANPVLDHRLEQLADLRVELHGVVVRSRLRTFVGTNRSKGLVITDQLPPSCSGGRKSCGSNCIMHLRRPHVGHERREQGEG